MRAVPSDFTQKYLWYRANLSSGACRYRYVCYSAPVRRPPVDRWSVVLAALVGNDRMPAAHQSAPELDLSATYHLKAVGCEQHAEHATDQAAVTGMGTIGGAIAFDGGSSRSNVSRPLAGRCFRVVRPAHLILRIVQYWAAIQSPDDSCR
jgi:hypothetical protein